ncbi:MAG: hypothetical protein JWR21_431 [Herminiimonas sp.]|nr:hypothetical protein [Herminiimonas sp.]
MAKWRTTPWRHGQLDSHRQAAGFAIAGGNAAAMPFNDAFSDRQSEPISLAPSCIDPKKRLENRVEINFRDTRAFIHDLYLDRLRHRIDLAHHAHRLVACRAGNRIANNVFERARKQGRTAPHRQGTRRCQLNGAFLLPCLESGVLSDRDKQVPQIGFARFTTSRKPRHCSIKSHQPQSWPIKPMTQIRCSAISAAKRPGQSSRHAVIGLHRATLIGEDPVVVASARGKHHHRDCACLPSRGQNLEAVRFGHHHVKHDNIEAARQRGMGCLYFSGETFSSLGYGDVSTSRSEHERILILRISTFHGCRAIMKTERPFTKVRLRSRLPH